MNWEPLREKSEQNFKTAQWAEEESYFDAALSRYYYTIYQKIIYISEKQDFKSVETKSKNSHEKTIEKFIANIKDKVSDEELIKISRIQNLRIKRNKADYKIDSIKTNDEFLRMFKRDFDGVYKIINKLIGDDQL